MRTVIQRLVDILDSDEETVIKWLNRPQDRWKGLTPLQMIELGNSEAVVRLALRIAEGLGEY